MADFLTTDTQSTRRTTQKRPETEPWRAITHKAQDYTPEPPQRTIRAFANPPFIHCSAEIAEIDCDTINSKGRWVNQTIHKR